MVKKNGLVDIFLAGIQLPSQAILVLASFLAKLYIRGLTSFIINSILWQSVELKKLN